jgi:molybdopterin molybdotransferase
MSVAEALARILDAAMPITDSETVPLERAFGRTLAADIRSTRTQPPMDVSAMDGYALRAADVGDGRRAKLAGESAAGRGFGRALAPGEAIRIFTGAPVPAGADTILVQEDAAVAEGMLSCAVPLTPGRHIRVAGLDFREGAIGLPRGTRLGPADVALAAAMNHPNVPVVRKPRVGILASGDELVMPGQTPGPDQIVCSNPYAVAAYVEGAGGEPIDLGIAVDTFASLEAAILRTQSLRCDVLVTLGGASVGDHDLVQSALTRAGMKLGFWRIAMRPGKPLIHGSLGAETDAPKSIAPMSILGLPGNPVSSIVCSILFLVPLLRKLSGDPDPAPDRSDVALLGADLKANDRRADYLRATLTRDAEGRLVATPHDLQDSSMLGIFTRSQALVLRAPFDPAAKAGDPCRYIALTKGGF